MAKEVKAVLNRVELTKVLIYREMGTPMIKVTYERKTDDDKTWDDGVFFFHGGLPERIDPDENPIPHPDNYIELKPKQLQRILKVRRQIKNVLGNLLLDEDNPDE